MRPPGRMGLDWREKHAAAFQRALPVRARLSLASATSGTGTREAMVVVGGGLTKTQPLRKLRRGPEARAPREEEGTLTSRQEKRSEARKTSPRPRAGTGGRRPTSAFPACTAAPLSRVARHVNTPAGKRKRKGRAGRVVTLAEHSRRKPGRQPGKEEAQKAWRMPDFRQSFQLRT